MCAKRAGSLPALRLTRTELISFEISGKDVRRERMIERESDSSRRPSFSKAACSSCGSDFNDLANCAIVCCSCSMLHSQCITH